MVLLVSASLVASATLATSASSSLTCPEESEDGVVRIEDLPDASKGGDKAIDPGCEENDALLADEDVSLAVPLPAPGDGVTLETLTENGADSLSVYRTEDGDSLKVASESVEVPSSNEVSATAVEPACSDSRYTTRGSKVYEPLTFYINHRSRPRNLGAVEQRDAIINAGDNVTNAFNDCDLPDNVDASTIYISGTTVKADVYDDSATGALACSTADGVSVVSYGAIWTGVLAAECNYTSGTGPDGYREVVESDIEVNKQEYTWTTNPGSSKCSDSYDLEGVVTHERGHTFGLDHAGTYQDSLLTMSAGSPACQSYKRTLGLGDVLGLEVLY